MGERNKENEKSGIWTEKERKRGGIKMKDKK